MVYSINLGSVEVKKFDDQEIIFEADDGIRFTGKQIQ